jgi:ABC-2 type transport system ATP-binding protein
MNGAGAVGDRPQSQDRCQRPMPIARTGAEHGSAAVQIQAAVKRYGARVAVDGLTLTVGIGEVFGLLGPNGSGKTTTVNLLTGLTRLTAGEIHVLGHNVSTAARRIRAQLGAVPQETALYEELTALHNLRLHADLYFVPRKLQAQRIEEVLELVQLTDRADSRVQTFSGGMKRRLALARALIHSPTLLVLDEPTLGVDVQSRRALWDRVLQLRSEGKTILITTNYLEEADALCDRIAIMDHGRLVALDTPGGLRSSFGTLTLDVIVEQPLGDVALAALQDIRGVRGVQTDGRSVAVTVDGRPQTAGAVTTLISGASPIRSLELHEPTLDAVFLELTGHAVRDGQQP